MIGSVSSSSFNLGSIGNVHSYATNLVKSYMTENKDSTNLVGGFLNNALGTTSKTAQSNVNFTKTNASNLNALKSTASSLGSTVRSAKDGDSEKIVKAAEAFAGAYNKAVGHLTNGSADGAGVSKALGYIANNRMTQMSMANYGGFAASRLQSMGISIDDDGMMQIDAEKLTAAFEKSPSQVKGALSVYGSLSDDMITNVDKALRIPAATYTNFSNMKVENSLLNALFSSGSSAKAGSLFDFLL
ncbi:flagellar filament capping protein FliD [Christensenellaceae bacterium OttesenSCG-928-K19]|nr:flagellar filament capping protein FliD [Christensenellaceae bacterium OttesenSCG-928-K19]